MHVEWECCFDGVVLVEELEMSAGRIEEVLNVQLVGVRWSCVPGTLQLEPARTSFLSFPEGSWLRASSFGGVTRPNQGGVNCGSSSFVCAHAECSRVNRVCVTFGTLKDV